MGREYNGYLQGDRDDPEQAVQLELVPRDDGLYLLKMIEGTYIAAELDNGGQLSGDRWKRASGRFLAFSCRGASSSSEHAVFARALSELASNFGFEEIIHLIAPR